MSTLFETAQFLDTGVVSTKPLRIYTGILGQIGDIVMFTATVRRLRELFPRSEITFAVSTRYREAGELVVGLPYIDRLFTTELYFEKMTETLYHPWHLEWPVDLRGDDEVTEHRRQDVVLETRPRHRRMPWWEFDHQVAEMAHMVGVPGPIDLQTEIAIPAGTELPPGTAGKIILHNDPSIDTTKAWPWESVQNFVHTLGAEGVVLVGDPGRDIPGTIDMRGQTTLAEAAAMIREARCYVGIDSGLMWIAGSLQVPTVGLYGTSYIPAYTAIQPQNPRAVYLQAVGALDQLQVEDVLTATRQVQRDQSV
ncbi:MAG: glycosyltransferase family 9 protein [Planctomycetes bacterium]|nr:glycosyltransferase family 9 protein [Planctomycetota bacterium]